MACTQVLEGKETEKIFYVLAGRRIYMTQVGEVYFCEFCGHKVGILHVGKGVLVCCGEPLKKQNNR